MRKQDVIECLENFIEKHWRNRDLVALPSDPDFIIKDISDVKISEKSLIEENDLKWSFNGTAKVTTTDERHTVTVSNLPYVLAGRAVIQPYPNQTLNISGEVNDVTELPEVIIIRIITLKPKSTNNE